MPRPTRVFLIGILALGVLLSANDHARAAQGERILGYNIHLEVQSDSTVVVTEEITVRARGQQIRRGIYRVLPTIFRNRSGGWTMPAIEVVRVTRNDQRVKWFVRKFEKSMRIYVGRRDRLIRPGRHVFKITYKMSDVVEVSGQNAELIWNVTGHGWTFAIDRIKAEIVLPPRARLTAHDAVTGRKGETGKDFTIAREGNRRITFSTTRALTPGEGLTIVVVFPKTAMDNIER